jgi:NTP pyrophosphatase (non-canonical NTP hydrolase)
MFKSYQERVDQWIKDYGVRYFNELTNTAILMEEMGELARIMARVYGEQSFKNPIEDENIKDKLGDELADIIFVLTCLSNQMGIDLDQAVERNFVKKTTRDINRHNSNEKLES